MAETQPNRGESPAGRKVPRWLSIIIPQISRKAVNKVGVATAAAAALVLVGCSGGGEKEDTNPKGDLGRISSALSSGDLTGLNPDDVQQHLLFPGAVSSPAEFDTGFGYIDQDGIPRAKREDAATAGACPPDLPEELPPLEGLPDNITPIDYDIFEDPSTVTEKIILAHNISGRLYIGDAMEDTGTSGGYVISNITRFRPDLEIITGYVSVVWENNIPYAAIDASGRVGRINLLDPLAELEVFSDLDPTCGVPSTDRAGSPALFSRYAFRSGRDQCDPGVASSVGTLSLDWRLVQALKGDNNIVAEAEASENGKRVTFYTEDGVACIAVPQTTQPEPAPDAAGPDAVDAGSTADEVSGTDVPLEEVELSPDVLEEIAQPPDVPLPPPDITKPNCFDLEPDNLHGSAYANITPKAGCTYTICVDQNGEGKVTETLNAANGNNCEIIFQIEDEEGNITKSERIVFSTNPAAPERPLAEGTVTLPEYGVTTGEGTQVLVDENGINAKVTTPGGVTLEAEASNYEAGKTFNPEGGVRNIFVQAYPVNGQNPYSVLAEFAMEDGSQGRVRIPADGERYEVDPNTGSSWQTTPVSPEEKPDVGQPNPVDATGETTPSDDADAGNTGEITGSADADSDTIANVDVAPPTPDGQTGHDTAVESDDGGGGCGPSNKPVSPEALVFGGGLLGLAAAFAKNTRSRLARVFNRRRE